MAPCALHGALACLAVGLVKNATAGPTVIVAPDAREHGRGTESHPYTLEAARKALAGRAAGATVLLRGGDYHLTEPFVMEPADGGTESKPVVYASFPGERARIFGATELPAAGFSDAGPGFPAGTLVADLRAAGVMNASQLGGGGDPTGLKAELFGESVSGSIAPLQLAQDPDPGPGGKWRWAGYGDVIQWSPGTAPTTWFVLNNTTPRRLAQWTAAVAAEPGLWLLGHWGDEGGFGSVRVAAVAAVPGTPRAANVTIAPFAAVSSGQTVARQPFQVRPTERFVATGGAALLDSPGEYFIDRTGLRLFYLPPPTVARPKRVMISLLPSLTAPGASVKHPMPLVQLASWVRWANISVAASTQALIEASGTNGTVIDGCRLEAAGASCATVDGENNSVRGTVVAECGREGVVLTGGNWDSPGPTLFRPANVTFTGNTVSGWARWNRVPSAAGLVWSGAGHVVEDNSFVDAPEPAVSGDGLAGCRFRNNTVARVNWEQSDMGAYYHGSSAGGYAFGWTQPGNVIEGNTFVNISFGEQLPPTGAEKFTTQAVYIDDELSGYSVVGNRFENVDVGVLLGGGEA